MTTLEIILIAIIWIGYGIFNGNQMAETETSEGNIIGCYLLSVVSCPLVIVFRVFWGIFSSKLW